jgi:predicted nuclease of predicted toxin-antitoxin system
VRLLTDQDAYVSTMDRAIDEQLLIYSQQEKRCFVTRDRDFGRLAFSHGQGGGVLYLRMTPSTVPAVHTELTRVLERHPEEELLSAFVVVEAARYRYRKLNQGKVDSNGRKAKT